MKLETLQNAMVDAMKSRDKTRKEVISSMITAIKNKSIEMKCRDNVPESLVDEVLLKEKKTMQEMIDTCPSDRLVTLSLYKLKMDIINEYAPLIMSDPIEIKDYINSLGIKVSKSNRGQLMKMLKGKADMKVANLVLSEMIGK